MLFWRGRCAGSLAEKALRVESNAAAKAGRADPRQSLLLYPVIYVADIKSPTLRIPRGKEKNAAVD